MHRLDKGTAGVLLVAKRPEVATALSAEWDSTQKIYEALVFGAVEPQTITTPIADKHGKTQSAVTQIDAAGRGEDVTRLSVRIHTGRKHQIRRHLAGIGHPVVMDDRYGDFRKNKDFAKAIRAKGGSRPRHPFLRAVRIVLTDGRSFEAPPPASWGEVLAAIGMVS